MTAPDRVQIEVRHITSPDDLEQAFEIRRRVFLVEQKVSPDEEFDADDDHALHVLAVVDGRATATGRLLVGDGYARIGRMAVLADHRGHGVGRAILDELIRVAAERGVRRLVLHAQVHAIGFYEASGFRVSGDVFEQAGIPHRNMERVL